ncbi:MAG: NAD(P)-binding protein [Thermoanaerobaculia bacterium]
MEPKIKVAIVGGGCAAMATAFELSRPEHDERYEITVYQLGWRLGGKGASGRGPSGRIEEHGLHLWMGYYENAFKLTRECYSELERDPKVCPICDWTDAFKPDRYVALADQDPDGAWSNWVAHFPPGQGAPGDPLASSDPFTVRNYMIRTTGLIVSLLQSVQERTVDSANPPGTLDAIRPDQLLAMASRLLRYGQLATLAAVIEAAGLLAMAISATPGLPDSVMLRLIDFVADGARQQLERVLRSNNDVRRLWEVLDLVLASLRGTIRFGLATDPRGFDAINDYETRDWLRMNGASESTLRGAFVRGLYDLGFAFEDGDPEQPAIAAGVGMRGAVRMFYTYRGALFWKMQAGMGDVVFAPFYEVLKDRGVKFEFFHRLENIKLAPQVSGEKPWVRALEFDVQAKIKRDGYRPLVPVRGLPCWPSEPDFSQLVGGKNLKRRKFESHWDRGYAEKKTLEINKDFDCVVLGVSLGAIPYVASEIIERDPRWRAMVENVKTVSTQAVQLWTTEPVEKMGWPEPPVNLSSFVQPFDTWADMRQLIEFEDWEREPAAIAYFCSVLHTPEGTPDRERKEYPAEARARVRASAIRFMNRDLPELWQAAADEAGGFRWRVLADAENGGAGGDTRSDESRFDTQFLSANVNPTDRYNLSTPGSLRFRISPLDTILDNLVVTGDWTDCGHNLGCVESAVMSGRLAAHAISKRPLLEEIVGYNHP